MPERIEKSELSGIEARVAIERNACPAADESPLRTQIVSVAAPRLIAEVSRLEWELMLTRLRLRHREEFFRINPELQSRWREYEEGLHFSRIPE